MDAPAIVGVIRHEGEGRGCAGWLGTAMVFRRFMQVSGGLRVVATRVLAVLWKPGSATLQLMRKYHAGEIW
ncbi:hypothetical protein amb1084 [Paramagnetospirillum magneticum AMB-1]|uniref:Uncharacterized protein n=1 Tax=Paramagnetospirillum magneticum (strain ATCC 700264 / AMB-1) TaxID=342108 RepID=Q2W8D7_PARM1|nr:hypothetical protein amb1084 [Paramagnetospirillum magneticum AMB-1]